jgi:hypothetical protein
MDNPFGLDPNVFHVYEFEIVRRPAYASSQPLFLERPLVSTNLDKNYICYQVAICAQSEFEAVILLLDKGCTPVKLLSTNQ